MLIARAGAELALSDPGSQPHPIEASPVVLLVEDEAEMRTFARIALAAHGYRAIEARTAAEGIRLAGRHRPDIVLLGLPDADGSEVTRRIREWSIVPILVTSARGGEAAKVKALDEGADEYMTKPVGAAEMMARIRVALRNASRLRADPPGVVQIGGDIRVDLPRRSVTVRGDRVHLTQLEFKLLAELVRHAGRSWRRVICCQPCGAPATKTRRTIFACT